MFKDSILAVQFLFTMTHIQFIQNQTNIAPKSIEATIKLLSEDCTIPFISRYRKDQTGNLDEVQIEAISKLNKQYDEIIKRKESILKSIEEQKALSPELKSKIENSFDLQELEDFYLPYKKTRKTITFRNANRIYLQASSKGSLTAIKNSMP